jgi:hypothetical protein
MTKFVMTASATVLALTTAMPAFAAAHMDVNTLTCGEYNAMSEEDRTKLAMMAVTELKTNAEGTIAPNDGTATATDSVDSTAAEESTAGSSTTIADNNGTATATSTAGAGDHESQYVEEIELLNLTCARSDTATLMEAAAGLDGTR